MPAAAGEPAHAAGGGRGRRFLLGPWLPTLVGALCFANSLSNRFAYDDHPLIVDNPRIRALAHLRQIWLSDWWYPAEGSSQADPQRDRLYRPLTLFTFALNRAVHELHPTGYHLVNVLLHAATCLLVWHFARRLADDPAVATVGAVFFAVHPIHAEAVANVVGRAEVLAALFMLIGLLVLLPRIDVAHLRRGLLAVPAFIAALLSKETAVCYPAVALLSLYATQRESGRSRRWWLMHAACLLVPLLVYFPLRYVALEQRFLRPIVSALLNPLSVATAWQRVLGAFTVLGHYTRLLIVPTQLGCDYGLAIVDPEAGFTPMTLLGLLTAGGAIVGLLGFIRRGPLWRQIAVLTAMSLASYALISNTLLLIGVSLAERLMYWPSVPILILAATGIVELWRRQCAAGRPLAARAGLLRGLGVLLLAALGLWSFFRNWDWHSNETLFERDATTHPQGAHLNKCYAYVLMQRAERAASQDAQVQLWTAAKARLDRALRIHSGYADALALRGRARALLGDRAGAARDLESALQLQPGHPGARRALVQLQSGAAEAEQRLTTLQQRVREHPNDPALRLEFGSALLEYGQDSEALEQFNRAVELEPDNALALRRQGEVLALLRQDQQAIEVFRRVITLVPEDWQAHANLTKLLAQTDAAAALRHALRAHQLQPNDLRTKLNLAEAYALNRQTAAALGLYEQIVRGLDPDNALRRVVEERIEVLRRR